jgi:hypothetical protein|tara:strand:- start:255 stop:434 length:180 start_codon:yes stop_codon:yes gene_type:complete
MLWVSVAAFIIIPLVWVIIEAIGEKAFGYKPVKKMTWFKGLFYLFGIPALIFLCFILFL